jgi:chromate transporter
MGSSLRLNSAPAAGARAVPTQRASLVEIALAIGAIALTSFGGGQKASIRQAFVTRRGWIDDSEFLEGLELAQIMPGPNLINLVIFIGQRLRGWAGAIVALLAVSIPPFAIVLAVGALYFRISTIPSVHAALVGCAAAAIGLTLANAIDLTREEALRPLPLLFLAITAVAVSVYKVPLLAVLGILGPLCILLYRPPKAA